MDQNLETRNQSGLEAIWGGIEIPPHIPAHEISLIDAGFGGIEEWTKNWRLEIRQDWKRFGEELKFLPKILPMKSP